MKKAPGHNATMWRPRAGGLDFVLFWSTQPLIVAANIRALTEKLPFAPFAHHSYRIDSLKEAPCSSLKNSHFLTHNHTSLKKHE